MSLTAVPVIDLQPYFDGAPDGKAAVARAVDEACRDIGFLVITNHQIDPALIERVSSLSRAFFERPLDEKRKVDRPSPEMVRGYSAVAEESLSYSLEEAAPGDLKESFSIGPTDVPADDPYYHGPEAGPHFAPNVWPDDPAFRDAYTAYFAAMSELSRSLMRIFALALQLPETFFDDKIDRHISMFRVLSYPALSEAPLPGQMRASAHSDYGSLTIVKPDGPGLQVSFKGQWLDVPDVPDGFVVNLGDLMAQWTNDQWISTLHRVIVPPLESPDNRKRQSLVFFHQPNYDAMVECLPACCGEGAPAKYAPVSSGDHLLSKFVKQTTFGGTKLAA